MGLGEPLLDLSIAPGQDGGGVRPEIGESLIGKVRDELSSDELADRDITRVRPVPPVGDAAVCWHNDQGWTAHDRPRGRSNDPATPTIARLGLTGVGKTTTIAKPPRRTNYATASQWVW